MGLDSYVYRVSKPEGLEDRVYSSDEFYAMGLSAIPAELQDEPSICELMPYCVDIRIEMPHVNMEKVCADYGFGESAEIVAQNSDGSIVVYEKNDDGNEHFHELSGAEVREKYLLSRVEDYIAFQKEEIAYWRKDYDVSEFFADSHKGGIENTGYYILDLDTILQFNSLFADELPVEEPNAESALFYWEWY